MVCILFKHMLGAAKITNPINKSNQPTPPTSTFIQNDTNIFKAIKNPAKAYNL